MFKTAAPSPLIVVLSLVWCGTVSAGEQQTLAAGGTGAPAYQDLLFLDAGRPIVVRLHLVVDGRPFVNVWGEYVQRLFTLADRDGDGSLSRDETQSPARSDDALGEELFSILSLPGLAQSDVEPVDGALSFDEFAAFVARYRGGPFQPPPSVSSVGDAQNQPVMAPQSANAGTILFDTLDVTRDGRISRDELEHGSESIGKLDFDGDGASSLEELDHLRGAFGRAPNVAATASAVPIRALSPDGDTSELIQTVVATYGGAPSRGSGSLSITQLGYRDGQMAEFDADANGQLDRDELRYWLTHPRPHLELMVRIGERPEGQESVAVTTPPTLEDVTVRTSDLGLVSIVVGGVQLEIGVGPGSRNEESVRQLFANRFRQFDRDGNGYLEPKEVSDNLFFEQSFNRFDRDGDGKMFEEEMLAAVGGQIVASLSRTRMASANRGKDLFEILDTNRDQRVSRRELLGARDRFDLWDADEDSRLADSEVPQLYQLVFDRGTPDLPGFNVSNLPVSFAASGGKAAAQNVPAWFQKMDRNGDGDVSRREFLGTPAQFDRLDVDGNRLIDALEGLSAAISE